MAKNQIKKVPIKSNPGGSVGIFFAKNIALIFISQFPEKFL